ncbi:hypothetical protein V6N13_063667 [Hibiscus sabdariffa]|uniref:GRF-type domain-containing protein n=1 Tax=Hibiscus sabdariffa TaxID=183260 RepID=A0ABR2R0T4_9ROSI
MGQEMFCDCGNKCPMWTAWKNSPNLGRRFFSCPNYRTKDCGFLRWVDEPLSESARFLIYELKKENDTLQKLSEDYSRAKCVLEMKKLHKQITMIMEKVDSFKREKYDIERADSIVDDTCIGVDWIKCANG